MSIYSLRDIDPRPKLMIMAASSTVCMFTENIMMICVVIVLLVLVMLIGGANLYQALIRVRGILGLIIFLFLIQGLFMRTGETGLEPLLTIGNVGLLYVEGLKLATVLSLRLIVIVVSALILVEGDTRDYLLAFVQMKVPYEISFMVIVALHFIPILREEAVSIHCSMQLRGKDFKRINIFKKMKAYFNLCLPILVRALRRADEMSIAMEARGFRAKPGRTNMRRLKMRKIDVLLLVAWPLIMILLYLSFNVWI